MARITKLITLSIEGRKVGVCNLIIDDDEVDLVGIEPGDLGSAMRKMCDSYIYYQNQQFIKRSKKS